MLREIFAERLQLPVEGDYLQRALLLYLSTERLLLMLLHYHSRKFHPHALPRARSNGGTGDWTTRVSRAAPWWILYRTAQTLLSDARHCCLLAHHRAAHCQATAVPPPLAHV